MTMDYTQTSKHATGDSNGTNTSSTVSTRTQHGSAITNMSGNDLLLAPAVEASGNQPVVKIPLVFCERTGASGDSDVERTQGSSSNAAGDEMIHVDVEIDDLASSQGRASLDEGSRPDGSTGSSDESNSTDEGSSSSEGGAESIQGGSRKGSVIFAERGLFEAGFGSMARISNAQRLRSLVAALQGRGSETQLVALQELTEQLSMGMEEMLLGLDADKLARELVRVLSDGSASAMLLACRCLANLLEALPLAGGAVVRHGAVEALCALLLDIEYIDVAEQALAALALLSGDFGAHVCRVGGMRASLMFLDFFAATTQRTALTCAVNCARVIGLDQFARAAEVVPMLECVVLSDDPKLAELSCSALVHMVCAFRTAPGRVEQLVSPELLQRVITAIRPGGAAAQSYSCVLLLRVLAAVAAASRTRTVQLLRMQVLPVLVDMLSSACAGLDKAPGGSAHMHSSALQVPERLWEALRLIMVLLPRLPTIPEQCVLVEDLVRTGGLGAGPSDNMATFSDAHSSNSELLIHLQAIYASTEVLEQLQQTLVPLMMRVFAATTNVSTRYRALLMVLKVLFFLDAGRLHKTLDGADLPQFVAGAVSQLEVPLLSAVLLLIMRVVLEKLPDYYTPHFIREGVFAGLGRLALAAEGVLDAPRSEDAVENVSSIKNIASGFKLIASHISALDYHEISGGSYHLLLSAESSSGAHARNADPLVCFVALQARALLPNFSLTSDTELPDGEYGAMRPLKLLAARLGASDCTDDSVRSCIEALAECLVSPESATSHELMQSGLVRVVTQALTRTRSSGQSLAIDVVQRLLRCNAPSQPNSLATSALGVLLNRLQDALGIVEQIRVQEAFQSATDASRSPARMLSHQLRFAVCPASADAAARITAASFGANFADAECLSNTMELLRRSFQPIRLGVHAVATFGVLETYLRPRIALLVRSARERRRRRNQVQSTAASSPTSASTPLIASPPRRAQLENVAIDPTSASCLDSPNRSISKRQRDHLRMLQAIARASGINLRTAGLLEGLETDNSTSNYDEDSVSEGSSAANLTANSNTQIAGASIVQASDTDDHVCLAAHDNVPEEQGDWHLTFLLCVGANEKAVTSSDNIFRAVYDLCQSDAELRSTNTWAQSFKLHFVVNSGPRPSSDCDVQSKDHLLGDTCSTDSCKDLYASIGEQAADIVRLLRLLYDLLPRAMSSAHAYSYYCLEDLSPLFVNRKIAAKTARQLDDPLMVVCSALPDWCRHIITAAPFLIPFELRVAFMQATCFGYSRNINRWQAIARRELHTTVHALPDLQIPLGHVQRQKVRISRRRMLESALKVIELYGSPKSILEVEYFDEVGSGIGPTLEFYATVSRCLQEKSIGLWRDERLPDLKADTYGHVTSPQFAKYVDVKHGLYPAYLDPERVSGRSASSIGNNTQSAKSLHTVTASLPTVDRATELFRFIGHFVAKGLIDGRILDIPFSTVFWAAVHRYLQISHGGGSEFTWTWFQLEALDAVLTNSLRYINQFVATTRDIYAREDLSPAQVQEAIDSIRHPNDQASVEDLALDFTLPGRPDIELRPGGAEIPVTIKNIHLYIDLVARWTLYTGVRVQVAAFCEGFDRVFSSKNLLMFTPAELCSLVGQDLDSNVHWSMDELVDAIKTDHGFSLSSSEVQMFLEFLTSLENPDRRMLLQFVTGSPRLPLGGFRSLQPPLTLVPRTTSPPLKPDDYLPSVMTCANFIKLPRYSSFDVLAQRWRQAISEGQQSFHLS